MYMLEFLYINNRDINAGKQLHRTIVNLELSCCILAIVCSTFSLNVHNTLIYSTNSFFEKNTTYSFILLHTDVDKGMTFQKIEILSSNYHLRVNWVFSYIKYKSLYIIHRN